MALSQKNLMNRSRVFKPSKSSCEIIVRSLGHDSGTTAVRTVVYEGVLVKPLKMVKKISLVSCATAAAASVALISTEMSALGVGFGALISSVGFGTTGLLHWLTTPYIASIRVREENVDAKDYVEATTFTIFGTKKTSTFSLEQVRALSSFHPFAVFHAAGRDYHVEVGSVDDLYLSDALSRVIPQAESTDAPKD